MSTPEPITSEKPPRAFPGPISRGLMVLAAFFGAGRGCAAILGPETCRDGWRSSSIGIQGACSWHGGVQSHSLPVLLFGALCAFGLWLVLDADANKREMIARRIANAKHRATQAERERTMLERSEVPCPVCRGGMVRRLSKRGLHKGSYFYGCARFPSCRGALSEGARARLLRNYRAGTAPPPSLPALEHQSPRPPDPQSPQ